MNVWPPFQQLKPGCNWAMYQDGDPKHTIIIKKKSCWKGQVKIQTSTLLRFMLCINKCPETSINWSSVGRGGDWVIISSNCCESPNTLKRCLYMLMDRRVYLFFPPGLECSVRSFCRAWTIWTVHLNQLIVTCLWLQTPIRCKFPRADMYLMYKNSLKGGGAENEKMTKRWKSTNQIVCVVMLHLPRCYNSWSPTMKYQKKIK